MRSLFLWLGTLLFSMGLGPIAEPYQAARIQSVVDELKSRLAITAPVTATIVPSNPLAVSVEPQKGRSRAFVLSFEAGFADGLDDNELVAAIAHELGHVWIFTHHPYLQTERLANEVAMRVVTRESLQKVYAKVWERQGAKVDLAQVLGQ